MTRRAVARALVVTMAVVFLTVGVAGPVGAHGAGGAGTETPNYVTAIVDPGDPGLEWDIDIGHARIRLTNNTDRVVTIYGYRGEPYLRFDPDGTVWTNANAPTTYLNQHRYGDAEIPNTASPTAEPDWQPAGHSGSYAWWDHRAHWMATDPPDTVSADPDKPHRISDWSIPLRVGDTDTAATGQLRWAPDLAWWPPILALTTIATAVTAFVLVTSRPEGDRWPRPARTVAALIAMVAAANVVRGVDEAFTVADTTAGGIVVVITASVAASAIAALAWRGRRGRVESYLALFGAAFLAAIIFGGESLAEITAPQLVTGLPEWTRRWTIAASYAVIAPAGLVAFVAGRRLSATTTHTAAATIATPTGPEAAH